MGETEGARPIQNPVLPAGRGAVADFDYFEYLEL